MIRRSTLVFLTCLAALGVPAMRTQSAASSAVKAQELPSQLLLAQAPNGESSGGALSAAPLGIGSTGEAVSALQRRLRQSNYYGGSVDGLYGLGTQKAVLAFQADQGLSQTGSMTDETWERLQSFVPSEDASSAASGAIIADDNSAAENNAEGVSDDGGERPATAPTDSELPPVGSERERAATSADDSQGDGRGLGKIFGLSLGLVALLSSFGVGFYFANRSKSEPEESEGNGWITADGGVGLSPSMPAPPSPSNPGVASIVDNGVGNSAPFSSNGVSANGNGAAHGGSSLATAGGTSSLRTGQIGGTAPLAQVDIMEGLIGDLRNPDPTRRRKAIWELGQRGNSLAMQPLVDSMVNADSKEKSLVLAALSEIGIRSLKPMSRALAIALQDDNPDVRKNGIRDLTRVYELVVQISQMLGHATEDEDPEVRQTATWALDQLNRIRRSQDLDSTVRTFTGSTASPPIDLLSSEASMRRNSQ
ncbi:MAG: peptidoglycan-binding protein [Cyanobacteria bacterium P01_F01_bin.53]